MSKTRNETDTITLRELLAERPPTVLRIGNLVYPVVTLPNGDLITLGELIAWRTHGPMPEGMTLAYLNGDPLDCRTANLAYMPADA